MPFLTPSETKQLSVTEIQADVNGLMSIVNKLETFYSIHGRIGYPVRTPFIKPTSEQILQTPLRSILQDLHTMLLRRGVVEVASKAMVVENGFILLVLVVVEGLSKQSRAALLEAGATISGVLEGLNAQCWKKIDIHLLDGIPLAGCNVVE